MMSQFPLIRKSGLAQESVANELIIYDLDRHKACCLNPVAVAVFQRCDGKTSPAQMAKCLGIDETLVWSALQQFSRDRLLEAKVELPVRMAWVTRRQNLRTLGKVAAVAVPVVTAMIAPTPAMAASCGGVQCQTGGSICSGQPCSSSSGPKCCTGTCPNGSNKKCP